MGDDGIRYLGYAVEGFSAADVYELLGPDGKTRQPTSNEWLRLRTAVGRPNPWHNEG